MDLHDLEIFMIGFTTSLMIMALILRTIIGLLDYRAPTDTPCPTMSEAVPDPVNENSPPTGWLPDVASFTSQAEEHNGLSKDNS